MPNKLDIAKSADCCPESHVCKQTKHQILIALNLFVWREPNFHFASFDFFWYLVTKKNHRNGNSSDAIVISYTLFGITLRLSYILDASIFFSSLQSEKNYFNYSFRIEFKLPQKWTVPNILLFWILTRELFLNFQYFRATKNWQKRKDDIHRYQTTSWCLRNRTRIVYTGSGICKQIVFQLIAFIEIVILSTVVIIIHSIWIKTAQTNVVYVQWIWTECLNDFVSLSINIDFAVLSTWNEENIYYHIIGRKHSRLQQCSVPKKTHARDDISILNSIGSSDDKTLFVDCDITILDCLRIIVLLLFKPPITVLWEPSSFLLLFVVRAYLVVQEKTKSHNNHKCIVCRNGTRNSHMAQPTEIIKCVLLAIELEDWRQHNVTISGTTYKDHQSHFIGERLAAVNVLQFNEVFFTFHASMDHVTVSKFCRWSEKESENYQILGRRRKKKLFTTHRRVAFSTAAYHISGIVVAQSYTQ